MPITSPERDRWQQMNDEQDPGRKHDLIEEGRRVGLMLASRRSEKLLRLFNFLLAQSQEGRRPEEAEIAAAVRDGDPADDTSPGSSVRVYVSRLRKMLDQHYATRPGPRLVIPHGEYRIVLEGQEGADPVAAPSRQMAARMVRGKWLLGAVAGLNLILGAAFWASGAYGTSGLAQSNMWEPIASGRHPLTLLVGDYFLFGERRGGAIDRIVRDLAVRSREDFRAHATGADRPVDLDLAYVSSNAVFAVRSLWVALEELELRQPPATVTPASELDPEILKSSDIVYVGPIDSLGMLLENSLARASSFALDGSGQELIDRRSGRRYRSDLSFNIDDTIPRRDYGYIASVVGPAGNRIIIISGLGDAGIAQMADLAASETGLAELAAQVGRNGENFEALYQVRAMYSQSYGRKLIVARSMSGAGIWDMPASGARAAAGNVR